LIKNKKSNTNIKIYCLDTRYEPIRAEIDEPFYAKTSDRVYLTLKALDKEIINEKNEKEFCKLFNQKINEIRNKYYNLIFTTYRDFGRKRLSFNFAYKLATLVAKELKRGK
ncbi:MAG: hypothetical protein LBV42_02370, partial [Methanobrevibacter sp.]|nr:hypothetical protein [Methanobrevibacter sp.]